MRIKYRTYKPGDENQLADLFNKCFHMEGSGFCRTPKSILWRYIHRPNFLPQEIRIAEDLEKKKIVGSIYATIEHYSFNKKDHLTGCINDVAVLLDYGRKGIAKNLLNEAHQFLSEKKCKYSVMSADPSGHAFNKLYTPYGYHLIHKSLVKYLITPYFSRYIPISLFFAPMWIYLQMLLKNATNNLQKRFGTNSVKIQVISPKGYNYRKQNFKFFLNSLQKLYHKSMAHFWNSFPIFSFDTWNYFRGEAYIPDFTPWYVVISQNKRILGFTSFIRQWIYLEKYGLRFPLAILRDWVIDPDLLSDEEDQFNVTRTLLLKTYQAAFERKTVALLIDMVFDNNAVEHTFRKCLDTRYSFKEHSPGYAIAKLSSSPPNDSNDSVIKPFFLGKGEIFMYP